MDGFKNSTKTKYMCGGPVRKATGGAIKSVAPKGVMKSAASAKQLPTPEIASKRQVQPTPPKDVVREAPRPTVEPKRQVQPTPPKDVRTIGGAPKDAKTIGGAAQTMGGASRDAKTMGSVSPSAKTIGGIPRGMGNAPAKATAAPRGMGGAPEKAMAAPRGMGNAPEKAISSVSTAKRGVPVASKKPMIGLKTGGSVTKSMCKW